MKKQIQENFPFTHERSWQKKKNCASVHFIGQASNLSRSDLPTDLYGILLDMLHFVSLTLPCDIDLQSARDIKLWNTIGTERMIGFSECRQQLYFLKFGAWGRTLTEVIHVEALENCYFTSWEVEQWRSDIRTGIYTRKNR